MADNKSRDWTYTSDGKTYSVQGTGDKKPSSAQALAAIKKSQGIQTKRTHGPITIAGKTPGDHGEAHAAEHARLKAGHAGKKMASMASRAASGLATINEHAGSKKSNIKHHGNGKEG